MELNDLRLWSKFRTHLLMILTDGHATGEIVLPVKPSDNGALNGTSPGVAESVVKVTNGTPHLLLNAHHLR